MRVVTDKFSKYGHPEFSLCYDPPIVADQVEGLVSMLEQDVAAGAVYKPQETLQLGWMLNRLFADEENNLSICEPDFKSAKLDWVPSVNNTIRDMFLQNDVVRSVAMDQQIDFPVCTQYALMCNKFPGSPGFYMQRSPSPTANPSESGWIICCIDPDHDHSNPDELDWKTVYECAIHNRDIVPFLALPNGVMLADTGNPDDFFIALEGKELEIAGGSYLAYNLSKARSLRQHKDGTEQPLECNICHQPHDIGATELGFQMPDAVHGMPVADRETRCRMSRDLCVLDNSQFFIRGVLPMPVAGLDEPFGIGAWAQVDQPDFIRYTELWDDNGQGSEPPFEGMMANDIDGYPSTSGLMMSIRLKSAESRPDFILTDTNHPLALEQRNGMDIDKLMTMLHRYHAL